jgi:hypothetical protein
MSSNREEVSIHEPWHVISRILAVGYGLLLALLALDLDTTQSFVSIVVQTLIHLIPALIVFYWALVSVVKPHIAGVGFAVTGIAFTLYFQTYDESLTFLLLSGPPMIISLMLLYE